MSTRRVTRPIPVSPTLRHLCPAGSLTGYAGTLKDGLPPEGWLLCDGTAYKSADYPDLFEAVGYLYSGGNPVIVQGEDQPRFRVPDCRGRVLVSSGAGTGLSERRIAESFGAEAVTLTVGQMPRHRHGINAHRDGAGFGGVDEGGGAEHVATEEEGGGGAHENMQPSIVVHFIIKY